jgi:hypothetical protein
MKKLSLVLICILFLTGCEPPEFIKKERYEREKVTISKSHYCLTILHDEHLFIMPSSGFILHHPDCPCFKNQPEKPVSSPSPIIIDFNRIK